VQHREAIMGFHQVYVLKVIIGTCKLSRRIQPFSLISKRQYFEKALAEIYIN
jgi:hypothetical protein